MARTGSVIYLYLYTPYYSRRSSGHRGQTPMSVQILSEVRSERPYNHLTQGCFRLGKNMPEKMNISTRFIVFLLLTDYFWVLLFSHYSFIIHSVVSCCSCSRQLSKIVNVAHNFQCPYTGSAIAVDQSFEVRCMYTCKRLNWFNLRPWNSKFTMKLNSRIETGQRNTIFWPWRLSEEWYVADDKTGTQSNSSTLLVTVN